MDITKLLVLVHQHQAVSRQRQEHGTPRPQLQMMVRDMIEKAGRSFIKTLSFFGQAFSNLEPVYRKAEDGARQILGNMELLTTENNQWLNALLALEVVVEAKADPL